jgi:hypothetical protein
MLLHGDGMVATGAANGLNNLRREAEADILRHHLNFFDAREAVLPQVIDDALDENLRRGGSGGDGDVGYSREPVGVDGLVVINQVPDGAEVAGDLDQTVGVGAVRGANDENEVSIVGDIADGHLAVLRGVADVLRVRPGDVGVLGLEGVDDVAGLVERERGLREVSDTIGVRHLKGFDVGDVRDDLGDIGRFAEGAFDLVVVAVADEDQRVALLGKLDGLNVDLGDQRAGGVNDLEVALFAGLADRGRDAMGGVNDPRTVGDLFDLVDEDRAFLGQLVHNIAIVDDFAANVDGRSEGLEGDANDVNGTYDTRAEATGLEEQHALFCGGSASLTAGGGWIQGGCGHPPSIPAPEFFWMSILPWCGTGAVRCG